MKATRRVVKFAAGGLWVLLACNAIAGHVTIHDEVVEEDDIDLTVVATNTAYRYHAVAASKWLLDTLDSSTNQAKDRIKDHEFKRFKNGFVSGTFVSARYTWTNDRIGRDGAMIYHAASGQPRPWLPDRMTPVADYERYFPSNHLATHAVIGDAAASGVSHTDIGGTPHGNDAEIKLLRTLEQDLRNQAVGTGGGFTSMSAPRCATPARLPCSASRQSTISISMSIRCRGIRSVRCAGRSGSDDARPWMIWSASLP